MMKEAGQIRCGGDARVALGEHVYQRFTFEAAAREIGNGVDLLNHS